jgi:putative transposase
MNIRKSAEGSAGMARIAGVVVPDLPHHVTQRDNRREPVFFAADDYRLYRRLVAAAARRAGADVRAYCLMPNHVHLIVIPADADGLRATFAEAHRRYTGAINARFRWTGHLFQGRFGAVVMDEPHAGGGPLHRAQSGGRRVGEPGRGLALVERAGAARGRG